MSIFSDLLDLACGKPIPKEDGGRARRVLLIVAALLLSVAFAAVWGVAVGSKVHSLALRNAFQVPMVIVFSALAAAPAGLLTWKLTGGAGRGSDLLVSFASSIFGGTLVLAVFAPLVALYYHSSNAGGPVLGQVSAGVAVLAGLLMFVRGTWARAVGSRVGVVLPMVVIFATQLAAMGQLISLKSILPERTVFDAGIDGFARSGK